MQKGFKKTIKEAAVPIMVVICLVAVACNLTNIIAFMKGPYGEVAYAVILALVTGYAYYVNSTLRRSRRDSQRRIKSLIDENNMFSHLCDERENKHAEVVRERNEAVGANLRLTKQNDELYSQYTQMTAANGLQEERLTQTQKQLAKSEQHAQDLKANLEDLTEQHTKLSAECDGYKKWLEDAHCMAMQAKGELLTARADNQALTNVALQQDKENLRLREIIAGLQSEIGAREQSERNLQSELKQNERKMATLRNQLTAKDETIRRLSDQVNAQNLVISGLKDEQRGNSGGRRAATKRQQSIQNLAERLQNLQADYEQDRQQRLTLQEELGTKIAENAALGDKCHQLTLEVKRLEDAVAESIEKSSQSEADFQELCTANQDLSEKLQKTTERLQHTRVLSDNLSNCIRLVLQTINEHALADLIRNDGAEPDDADNKATVLRREMLDLAERMCSYIDTIEQLTHDKRELMQDVNEQTLVIQQLTAKTQELQQTTIGLAHDLEIAENLREQMREEMETLRQQANENTEAECERKLEKVDQVELKELRQRIEELTKRNQRLEKYYRQTEEHLAVLRHYNSPDKKMSFYTTLLTTKKLAECGLEVADYLVEQYGENSLEAEVRQSLQTIRNCREKLKM